MALLTCREDQETARLVGLSLAMGSDEVVDKLQNNLAETLAVSWVLLGVATGIVVSTRAIDRGATFGMSWNVTCMPRRQ